MWFRLLFLLLLLTGPLRLRAATQDKLNLEFNTVVLGKVEQEKTLLAIRVSSEEGCHVALITTGSNPGTLRVSLDGTPGPEFEGILNRTPVFSPNEKRMFYGARKKERWMVCEAGRAEDANFLPKWDRVLETSFVFSPHSRHMAYIARRGNAWFVCADGKENGPYEEITNLPVFNKDGTHLIYGIRKGGQQYIINQGEQSTGFEMTGAAVLSPDGTRMAYSAQQDGRQFVVTDGLPGERYGGVYGETLQFSPDGKRLAYAAEKGARRFVVIDGKEERDFEAIGRGSLKISPDSRRVAYVARNAEKWMVVADGETGIAFDKVDNLDFSADSQHFAYVGGNDTGRNVVLDGTPGPEYPEIVKDSLRFSPSGAALVYSAVQDNKKTVLILNGAVLGEYDAVGTPAFSPDGKHLVYRANQGDGVFLFLDGQQIAGPVALICEPTFRRDGLIEFILIKENTLCRVTATLSKP